MDEPAAPPSRTRPFEAMVPGKPWSAKYLSVDDVTARQSRRGTNPKCFKDGTLRPDRPLPPGMLEARRQRTPAGSDPAQPRPRQSSATQSLAPADSPRMLDWQMPSIPVSAATTTMAGFGSHTAAATSPRVVATRHAMTPQFNPSCIREVVFGDPIYQDMSMHRPRPLPSQSQSPSGDRATASRGGGVAPRQASDEQRVRQLEAMLHHERRLIESTRAHVCAPPTALTLLLAGARGAPSATVWGGRRRRRPLEFGTRCGIRLAVMPCSCAARPDSPPRVRHTITAPAPVPNPAQIKTQLRHVPMDSRGLHDPAGQVFRGSA